MKKMFSRIVALIVVVVMLLSMSLTALAETSAVKATEHVFMNLMGQVIEMFTTTTIDEDGCLQIETSDIIAGEAIKALVQLGENALTVSMNGEAYTITREEVMKALETLEVVARQLLVSLIDLETLTVMEVLFGVIPIVSLYAQSPEFQNDMAAVYNILEDEVNRAAQIAFRLGYVVMSENGDVTIELDNVKILTLASAYLEELNADVGVFDALASLSLWSVLGMSEQAAQIASMVPGMIQDVINELNTQIRRARETMNLVIAVNQYGVSVDFSAKDYLTTTTLSANISAEGLLVAYERNYMEGKTLTTLNMNANDNGLSLEYYDKFYDTNSTTLSVAASQMGLYVNAQTRTGSNHTEAAVEWNDAFHVLVKEYKDRYGVNTAELFVDPVSGAMSCETRAEDANGKVTEHLTMTENADGVKVNYLSDVSRNNNGKLDFVMDNKGAALSAYQMSYNQEITVNATYDHASETITAQYLESFAGRLRANYSATVTETTISVNGNDRNGTFNVNGMMVGSAAMFQTGANYAGVSLNGSGSIMNGIFNYDANIAIDGVPGMLHVSCDRNHATASLSSQEISYNATFVCDPGKPFISLNVDRTGNGENTNIISAVASPRITDDTFAFDVKATVSGETVCDVTVGLIELEPYTITRMHGKAYVIANGEEETLEFNVIPDGSFAAFTLMAAGHTVAYILFESTDTVAQAPAHVSGTIIPAEQMVEALMSLLESVM